MALVWRLHVPSTAHGSAVSEQGGERASITRHVSPSQRGRRCLQLQRHLPGLRTLYITGTVRLGLRGGSAPMSTHLALGTGARVSVPSAAPRFSHSRVPAERLRSPLRPHFLHCSCSHTLCQGTGAPRWKRRRAFPHLPALDSAVGLASAKGR